MKNPLDWASERQMMWTRWLVERPRQGHRLYLWSGAREVLALGCLFALLWEVPQPWHILCVMVVSYTVAHGALMMVMRAQAYRDGWVRGRLAMVAALREAQVRDMTGEEWVTSQLEADLYVMGINPHVTDDDDA